MLYIMWWGQKVFSNIRLAPVVLFFFLPIFIVLHLHTNIFIVFYKCINNTNISTHSCWGPCKVARLSTSMFSRRWEETIALDQTEDAGVMRWPWHSLDHQSTSFFYNKKHTLHLAACGMKITSLQWALSPTLELDPMPGWTWFHYRLGVSHELWPVSQQLL